MRISASYIVYYLLTVVVGLIIAYGLVWGINRFMNLGSGLTFVVVYFVATFAASLSRKIVQQIFHKDVCLDDAKNWKINALLFVGVVAVTLCAMALQ